MHGELDEKPEVRARRAQFKSVRAALRVLEVAAVLGQDNFEKEAEGMPADERAWLEAMLRRAVRVLNRRFNNE